MQAQVGKVRTQQHKIKRKEKSKSKGPGCYNNTKIILTASGTKVIKTSQIVWIVVLYE